MSPEQIKNSGKVLIELLMCGETANVCVSRFLEDPYFQKKVDSLPGCSTRLCDGRLSNPWGTDIVA
jgi:hypothetical protein